ncbi:hypothetical protein LG293_17070 (plasmid) [Citricoccus nitrophenolicus]
MDLNIKTPKAPRDPDDVLWAVYDEPLMTLIAVVPTDGTSPSVAELAKAGLDTDWITVKYTEYWARRAVFHAGTGENPDQAQPVWQARPVEITGRGGGRLHFRHRDAAIAPVGTTLPMRVALPERYDPMTEDEPEPFTLDEVHSVLGVLGLAGEIEERQSGFVVTDLRLSH